MMTFAYNLNGWRSRNGLQLSSSLVRSMVLFMEKTLIVRLGQVLIFGSYLAHRSAANNSSSDRKALYATYNRASEGDLRTSYYEDRRKNWPATHMRKPGEDYAEGSLRYGYGSPMLSIDAGRQLIFVGEK